MKVTAEQRKGLADENYNNFSIRLRDEANGYVRVLAEANDYLDRQEIDNTNSEWIGMEITPNVSGSAVNVETLYVSTNGSSWNKLSKGTYGSFYLDGVQGNSFYLWYDTDDRDRVDDLYLATDGMGANKFQIRVDFDAYSASSSGSSSGSTSSRQIRSTAIRFLPQPLTNHHLSKEIVRPYPSAVRHLMKHWRKIKKNPSVKMPTNPLLN